MFGYNLIKDGKRIVKEHKKYEDCLKECMHENNRIIYLDPKKILEEFKEYKRIAEKYAKFDWCWNYFSPSSKKSSIRRCKTRLEVDDLCEELDLLQLKYNILLILSKTFDENIEEYLDKQFEILLKTRCKE